MATTSWSWSIPLSRAATSRSGTSRAPAMRAFSYSRGPRKSRSRGVARPAWASHAASSVALISLIGSKAEPGWLLGVDERRDYGLEQLDAVIRLRSGAAHDAGGHCRGFAHHGEQAPADLELLEQGAWQHRRRSGQDDDVIRRVALPAAGSIADLEGDIVRAMALEVAPAERRERRLDLHRNHMRRAVGEQRGEIAAAGAHFEHAVAFVHIELLQRACLELGLPHALAILQGNLQVREGKRAVLLRHELLARQHIEQIEHVLVEHLPGTDLLLHHIRACLLEIHWRAAL